MPCAPGGDVATHGAGADHVHALAVPVTGGEGFEVVAQEEDADQVLRGVGDEELGEG